MSVAGARASALGFNTFAYQREVKASALPTVQKCLLMVMAISPAYGSEGVCAGPDFSYPRLAAAITSCRYTVVRALAAVEGAGWLERIPGGRGKRNAYRLTLPGGAATAPEVIHNPSSEQTGRPPDPSTGETGTRLPGRPDPSTGETPIYPFLTEVPSISQRVRARLRSAAPNLQPDDDDLARLIAHLEANYRAKDAARYLGRCSDDDVRRLYAESKQPTPQVSEGTSTNSTADEAPAADCAHRFPGGTGLTRAGTPRCPECRAVAQISRSVPFSPSRDGLDPAGPYRTAQGTSGPRDAVTA